MATHSNVAANATADFFETGLIIPGTTSWSVSTKAGASVEFEGRRFFAGGLRPRTKILIAQIAALYLSVR